MSLKTFVITTANGSRLWKAEDEEHAREQHEDSFPAPDEPVGEEILHIQEWKED